MLRGELKLEQPYMVLVSQHPPALPALNWPLKACARASGYFTASFKSFFHLLH